MRSICSRRSRRAARRERRCARIWPTLRLGVLTSICGFSAMLFSGFTGFAQLGLFTIVGLVVALGGHPLGAAVAAAAEFRRTSARRSSPRALLVLIRHAGGFGRRLAARRARRCCRWRVRRGGIVWRTRSRA